MCNRHKGHLGRIGSGLAIGRRYCDLAAVLLNCEHFAAELKVRAALKCFLVERAIPARFCAIVRGLPRLIAITPREWLEG